MKSSVAGQAPHGPNTCPIAIVAKLVGDMWTLLIIRDLGNGPRRFGDLATSLQGISTRTLTQKLKDLESHGLVSRHEYKERPPRVVYDLTKQGHELTTIIDAMRTYGERHLKDNTPSK